MKWHGHLSISKDIQRSGIVCKKRSVFKVISGHLITPAIPVTEESQACKTKAWVWREAWILEIDKFWVGLLIGTYFKYIRIDREICVVTKTKKHSLSAQATLNIASKRLKLPQLEAEACLNRNPFLNWIFRCLRRTLSHSLDGSNELRWRCHHSPWLAQHLFAILSREFPSCILRSTQYSLPKSNNQVHLIRIWGNDTMP